MIKFIRRLWIALLNFLLIILPVVLLSQFLYFYRNPIAERFKNFLGNPVTEIIRTTESLKDQQVTSPRLKELTKFFEQLKKRKEISEADKESLRKALFQTHHALVNQLFATSNPKRLQELDKTYKNLLQSSLLDRIFPYPEQVRQELSSDLQRLQPLKNLPSHPAAGIKRYVSHADSVTQSIVTYGKIYGNRVNCQNLYRDECATVYSVSTETAASQLRQYFTTWPNFGAEPHGSIAQFNQEFPRLKNTYSSLGEDIEGYLQTVPWSKHEKLKPAQEKFKQRFVRNLQKSYRKTLDNLNLVPEDFTTSSLSSPADQLKELAQLESKLQSSSRNKNLLITKETRKSRQKLIDELREIYHWLLANIRFDENFQPDETKMKALRNVLRKFPGGEEFLRKEKSALRKIARSYERLNQQAEGQNYRGLRGSLAEIADNKLDPENKLAWTIMIKSFLKNNLTRFTDSTWQPLEDENQQFYIQLIEKVGEVGKRLRMQTIDESWVKETKATLKSRRFTQLKEKIKQQLNRPQFTGAETQLIDQLNKLQRLEDLPSPLAGKPEKIITAAIYCEKIRTGNNTLYRRFNNEINNNSFDQSWRQLNQIIEFVSTQNPREIMREGNLKNFAKQAQKWSGATNGRETLGDLLVKYYRERLQAFLKNLISVFKQQIRAPGETDFSPEELLDANEKIGKALEEIQKLPGFQLQFQRRAYQQLLNLRERLQKLRDLTANLPSGSLFGGNEQYTKFQNLTKTLTIESLPANYQGDYETKLFVKTHNQLISRAQKIHKKSSDDWLAGWGGRLTGREVLQTWINFIKSVNSTVLPGRLRKKIQKAQQNSQKLYEKWSG